MNQPFDDRDVILRWTTTAENATQYGTIAGIESVVIQRGSSLRFYTRHPNGNWWSEDVLYKFVVKLLAECDRYKATLRAYGDRRQWNQRSLGNRPYEVYDWWQGEGNGYDLAQEVLQETPSLGER